MIAAWFISDIHLKEMQERSGVVLLRFLRSLTSGERPVTHLFLLGDIFDLWVGGSDYFYRRFEPLVSELQELRRQGVEVHYFEGNHDLHLARFWEDSLGIPCWTSARYFQLGDRRLRLEHGDLINLSDEAYLRYRRFVRHPLMEQIAYRLPGSFLGALGDWASRTSRKYSSADRQVRENQLREMIRLHARRSYKESPFDAVISGHMHIWDDYEFLMQDSVTLQPRSVRSFNLGSWFESPRVLSLRQGTFEWVDLEEH